MRKIAIFIALIALSISSKAQVWSQVGNTLQRQTNGTYSNYRFNLGSPGFAYFYSKPQVDSIITNSATYTAGYGLGLTGLQFRLDSTIAVNKTFFNSVIGTATLNRLNNGFVPYTRATNDLDLVTTGKGIYAEFAEIGHGISTGAGLYGGFFYNESPLGNGLLVKGGDATHSNTDFMNLSNVVTAQIYGDGHGVFSGSLTSQTPLGNPGTDSLVVKMGSSRKYGSIPANYYAVSGGGQLTYTHTMGYGFLGGNYNNTANITSIIDTSKIQTISNFFPRGDTRYQKIGNYITALTGDGSASGPNSAILTLATVNTNTGSWGTASNVPSFIVNGKGLITTVSNTPIQIAESQVTNLTTDLNSKANLSGATFSGPVILNADPTASMGAATKNYVDNIATGIYWKAAVKAATIANIALSAAQTIDGVSVISGDRVLVKNQTSSTDNGIYIVSTGAWSRSPDNNTGALILASAAYVQSGGTVNGGTQWANSNTSSITIGTTPITYGQLAGAGVYTNGSGLNLTGNVFSLNASYTRGLFSFTAGSGAYNSSTGQITIPTDNSQIANGAGYLTSATGVSNIIGTANQVIASTSTGAITLSLPQSIATTSIPQFAKLGIGTSATRFLDVLGTTEQMRLAYDATHYNSHTVDASGNYTIAPSGGTANITGILNVSGGIRMPSGNVLNFDQLVSTNYTIGKSGTALNFTSAGSFAFNNLFTIANTVTSGYGFTFSNASSTGYGLYVQAASGTNPALRITESTGTTSLFQVLGNGNINVPGLTASKVVFTDASKNLTNTGIGTSSQFIMADGSLNSNTYLTSASAAGTYQPLENQRLSTTNNVTFRDITASRGDGTGVLFLNSANTRYLHYGSGTYDMPGTSGTIFSLTDAGNLTVTGAATATSFSGAGTGLTGTAASLSIGGNAASATTANNANALGGFPYGGIYSSGTLYYATLFNSTHNAFELADQATTRTFLGLGTNAYTSTAYLPTAAGSSNSLTDQLYITANISSIEPAHIVMQGIGATPRTMEIGVNTSSNYGYLQSLQAGVSYSNTPLAINPNGGSVFVGYTADPTSGNKFAVNGNGYFNGTGTFTGAISAPSFNPNSTQSTVSGSTSGSILAWQPFQGTTYKMVFIKVTSLNGSATYTYPSGFTAIPFVTQSGGSITVDTSSNSQVVVTSTGNSGYIKIEGY